MNMHYIEKVGRNLENWTAVIVQYGLIGKRYVKYQGDKKYRTLQEQSIKKLYALMFWVLVSQQNAFI